jgi:hypothetical protein
MELMYDLFFSIGVTGIVYVKFAKRVGYSNTNSVLFILGIVFIIAFLFFYTFTTYFIHIH